MVTLHPDSFKIMSRAIDQSVASLCETFWEPFGTMFGVLEAPVSRLQVEPRRLQMELRLWERFDFNLGATLGPQMEPKSLNK